MDHQLFVDPGRVVTCRWHLPPALSWGQSFQYRPIGKPYRRRIVRRINSSDNETLAGDVFKKRRVRQRFLAASRCEDHHWEWPTSANTLRLVETVAVDLSRDLD